MATEQDSARQALADGMFNELKAPVAELDAALASARTAQDALRERLDDAVNKLQAVAAAGPRGKPVGVHGARLTDASVRLRRVGAALAALHERLDRANEQLRMKTAPRAAATAANAPDESQGEGGSGATDGRGSDGGGGAEQGGEAKGAAPADDAADSGAAAASQASSEGGAGAEPGDGDGKAAGAGGAKKDAGGSGEGEAGEAAEAKLDKLFDSW